MAKIKIKGRIEPIEVSRDRADRLKKLKFGNGNSDSKADGNTLIDLDVWSGELSQVAWIDLGSGDNTDREKQKTDFIEKKRQERLAEEKAWQAKNPEEKSISCNGWANFQYGRITGNWNNKLSAKQLEKVQKQLLKFFTKEPAYSFPPPTKIIEVLFKEKAVKVKPEVAGAKISKGFQTAGEVSTPKAVCVECGKELTGIQSTVCSKDCYEKSYDKKTKKLTKKTE